VTIPPAIKESDWRLKVSGLVESPLALTLDDLRIYIPNLYGMKQPKWIESIEATDQSEPGYWVERGWFLASRLIGE